MASEAEAGPWFAQAGLGDVPRISDPAGELYRAVGLDRVAAAALLNPGLWARGFQCALLRGRGFGSQPRRALRQLPGVFLMHGGRILAAFRHRSPADRPDYLAIARAARG